MEQSILAGAFLGITALFVLVGVMTRFPNRGHGGAHTLSMFYVANRSVGVLTAALSIAATWIWAPALFVSAQKAYTDGWVGLFWFTVPNVGCLLLFAWFARRIRDRLPFGVTLPEFMRRVYSTKRTERLYVFTLFSLAVCSFAVQLLGGAWIVSSMTGFDKDQVIIIMTCAVLIYSALSGLRGSIATDALQMLLMLGVSAGVWAILYGGGHWGSVGNGLGGSAHDVADLFDDRGWTVFLAFGLPVTIGLLSGPFGDQSFWQRAFAIEDRKVGRSFALAAVIFAVVPLTMGALGFAAASAGLVSAGRPIALVAIEHLMPGWFVLPFMLMLIAGLTSTMDSMLCAASSLGMMHFDDKPSHVNGMTGMVVVALLGMVIAWLPGITILHLFLFYGTLRASTLLPTVMTLLWWNNSANTNSSIEPGVFWGILSSIVIGLPVFVTGQLLKDPLLITAGSLLTVGISGVAVLTMRSLATVRYQ